MTRFVTTTELPLPKTHFSTKLDWIEYDGDLFILFRCLGTANDGTDDIHYRLVVHWSPMRSGLCPTFGDVLKDAEAPKFAIVNDQLHIIDLHKDWRVDVYREVFSEARFNTSTIEEQIHTFLECASWRVRTVQNDVSIPSITAVLNDSVVVLGSDDSAHAGLVNVPVYPVSTLLHFHNGTKYLLEMPYLDDYQCIGTTVSEEFLYTVFMPTKTDSDTSVCEMLVWCIDENRLCLHHRTQLTFPLPYRAPGTLNLIPFELRLVSTHTLLMSELMGTAWKLDLLKGTITSISLHATVANNGTYVEWDALKVSSLPSSSVSEGYWVQDNDSKLFSLPGRCMGVYHHHHKNASTLMYRIAENNIIVKHYTEPSDDSQHQPTRSVLSSSTARDNDAARLYNNEVRATLTPSFGWSFQDTAPSQPSRLHPYLDHFRPSSIIDQILSCASVAGTLIAGEPFFFQLHPLGPLVKHLNDDTHMSCLPHAFLNTSMVTASLPGADAWLSSSSSFRPLDMITIPSMETTVALRNDAAAIIIKSPHGSITLDVPPGCRSLQLVGEKAVRLTPHLMLSLGDDAYTDVRIVEQPSFPDIVISGNTWRVGSLKGTVERLLGAVQATCVGKWGIMIGCEHGIQIHDIFTPDAYRILFFRRAIYKYQLHPSLSFFTGPSTSIFSEHYTNDAALMLFLAGGSVCTFTYQSIDDYTTSNLDSSRMHTNMYWTTSVEDGKHGLQEDNDDMAIPSKRTKESPRLTAGQFESLGPLGSVVGAVKDEINVATQSWFLSWFNEFTNVDISRELIRRKLFSATRKLSRFTQSYFVMDLNTLLAGIAITGVALLWTRSHSRGVITHAVSAILACIYSVCLQRAVRKFFPALGLNSPAAMLLRFASMGLMFIDMDDVTVTIRRFWRTITSQEEVLTLFELIDMERRPVTKKQSITHDVENHATNTGETVKADERIRTFARGSDFYVVDTDLVTREGDKDLAAILPPFGMCGDRLLYVDNGNLYSRNGVEKKAELVADDTTGNDVRFESVQDGVDYVRPAPRNSFLFVSKTNETYRIRNPVYPNPLDKAPFKDCSLIPLPTYRNALHSMKEFDAYGKIARNFIFTATAMSAATLMAPSYELIPVTSAVTSMMANVLWWYRGPVYRLIGSASGSLRSFFSPRRTTSTATQENAMLPSLLDYKKYDCTTFVYGGESVSRFNFSLFRRTLQSRVEIPRANAAMYYLRGIVEERNATPAWIMPAPTVFTSKILHTSNQNHSGAKIVYLERGDYYLIHPILRAKKIRWTGANNVGNTNVVAVHLHEWTICEIRSHDDELLIRWGSITSSGSIIPTGSVSKSGAKIVSLATFFQAFVTLCLFKTTSVNGEGPAKFYVLRCITSSHVYEEHQINDDEFGDFERTNDPTATVLYEIMPVPNTDIKQIIVCVLKQTPHQFDWRWSKLDINKKAATTTTRSRDVDPVPVASSSTPATEPVPAAVPAPNSGATASALVPPMASNSNANVDSTVIMKDLLNFMNNNAEAQRANAEAVREAFSALGTLARTHPDQLPPNNVATRGPANQYTLTLMNSPSTPPALPRSGAVVLDMPPTPPSPAIETNETPTIESMEVDTTQTNAGGDGNGNNVVTDSNETPDVPSSSSATETPVSRIVAADEEEEEGEENVVASKVVIESSDDESDIDFILKDIKLDDDIDAPDAATNEEIQEFLSQY